MDVTTRAALITTGGVVLAALLAWLGSRRIPKAQRQSLMVETAERVVRLQETERLALAQRITELEAQVQTLRVRYAEREHELEQQRGENARLSAEVGTLRANLAAKEVELATARALLAAATSPVLPEGTTS